MIINKDRFENIEGILVHPPTRRAFEQFESAYTALRAREGRIESPELVRLLPDTPSNHPFHHEWKLRKQTTKKLLAYLGTKPLRILDIGCGNGFLSKHMANLGHEVVGVDVNLSELRLASLSFGSKNPTWLYADVMDRTLQLPPFDQVVFYASLQYFENPQITIERCMQLLKPNGEIHILDTPLYKHKAEALAARQRSLTHFRKLGSENMGQFHYCHPIDFIAPFKHKLRKWTIKELFQIGRRNPFPWITILNTGRPRGSQECTTLADRRK